MMTTMNSRSPIALSPSTAFYPSYPGPSNQMSASRSYPVSDRGPARNPQGPVPSISELAERALVDIWDPSRDLKHYLRSAQRSRDAGKQLVKQGDLENAFVELARAATIILEKLPTHRDYKTTLTEEQRHNLGLNGQDILDSLSKLKPTLVERHSRWLAQHPDGVDSRTNQIQGVASPPSQSQSQSQSQSEDERAVRRRREEEYNRRETESRLALEMDARRRAEAEEMERRRETLRRDENAAALEAGRRVQEAAAARRLTPTTSHQREAASHSRLGGADGGPSSYLYQRGERESVGTLGASMESMSLSEERRERERRKQEYERKRDEENRRQRKELEERRREEVEGIVRRQQEAEEAVRMARMTAPPAELVPSTQGVISSASAASSQQVKRQYEREDFARRQREADVTARAVRTGQVYGQESMPAAITPSSVPASASASASAAAALSSARQAAASYEQDVARRQREAKTAAHAALSQSGYYDAAHREGPAISASPMHLPAPVAIPGGHSALAFLEGHHKTGTPIMPLEPDRVDDDSSTDAGSDVRGESGREVYVNGSGKQPKAAGRRSPSYPLPITTTSPPPKEIGSIRYPTLMNLHQKSQGYAPSLQSMFLQTNMGDMNTPSDPLLFQSSSPSDLYSNILPQQSAPVVGPYGMPMPQSTHHRHQSLHRHGGSRVPSPARARYPSPNRHSVPPAPSRIARAESQAERTVSELKTVNLPRECLPKFLHIAAVNTAKNVETCGLLLGRDKGHKFVVSTLLIPKQHATSDTCAMDEEELVMEFVLQRDLITLGWIHTHPTQSCFMSSLDLHTHGSFQRMLPESFAVVCAPNSTPNFGIFRLTDPPGLQTILDCQVKAAFHPHPDVPIYTDADKGHVQMKDIFLEIVDLR